METNVQGIRFLKKYEKHEQKIFSTNKIIFQHISCTYAMQTHLRPNRENAPRRRTSLSNQLELVFEHP